MESYKEKAKKIPMRTCLVSKNSVAKKDLIRFVIDPQKQLIADIQQNLPGKGYWVKADRETISKAIKKNLILKAVNQKIDIDKNLMSTIEFQIKQKVLQQISLSRKSGQAIFGFDKIKAAVTNNSVNLLIQAADGSDKEKKRMLNKSIPNIIDKCLTSSELGKIFGREKVVHCAILGNSFIEKIIFNANRLNNLKNPLPPYTDIEISGNNQD